MYKNQTRPKIPNWLRNLLNPYFKPTSSSLLPGVKKYIQLHPIGFEIFYRTRIAKFLVKKKFGLLNGHLKEPPKASSHLDVVVDHNFRGRWAFSRQRTEKLMNVLRCVSVVSDNSRILCIGPRNEAEILLLSLYGFNLKNITGIDLFSLGESIRPMDMHNMDFPDGTFDIVYTAWTLRYAYDLNKACREIIRVLKDGGIVACGFSFSQEPTRLAVPGSELRGGIDELLSKFQPHIRHIYWQESDPVSGSAEGSARVTAIFSIKK